MRHLLTYIKARYGVGVNSVTADFTHSTLHHLRSMAKEVEKQEKLPRDGQVGIKKVLP